MTSSLLAAVVVVLLAVALAAVMSAAEQAVPLLSRSRARRLAESERRGAAAVDALQERAAALRAASQAAVVFASAAAACAGALAVPGAAWPLASAGAVAGLALVFGLGVALPRTVAVQNPEGVALASAPMARRVTAVLHPVAGAFAWPWAALMRLSGAPNAGVSPWATEDDARDASPEDDEDSARDEAEDALVEAVADFTTKVVREVMVPRTDMVVLEDTATIEEAVGLVREAGVSRLPVYHGTLDDVVGILYAKDLLLKVAAGERVTPAAIARPPLFVPETKPVGELLVEMRRTAHIAIVADEYGGTAGLVTIEDLIEEIVGEIFDEYDTVEQLVFACEDGTYRVDARLPVGDLDDLLGTAIETDSDTVGGLVTQLAGRIPAAGDTVSAEGLRFTVEELEGARIRYVTVGPVAAETNEEGADR